MADINLNNYEEFIIDYFDGNLSSAKTDELMSFLNKHPELKQEFHSLETNVMEKENYSFPFKNSIKKETLLKNNDQSNFEELCIAKIEGDLNPKEEKLFDEILAESNNQKEFDLYKLVKLEPDTSVVFKDKTKLKKAPFSRKLIYSVISAAASVIIVVGLYFTIQKNTVEQTIEIPEKLTQVEQKIQKSSVESDPVQEIKKEKTIAENNNSFSKPAIKKEVIEKEPKEKTAVKEDLQDLPKENLAMLSAQIISIDVKKVETELLPVSYGVLMPVDQQNEDDAISIKSFIASNVKKRIFNKKKDKIELFDIAQASIEGVNKLAGTNMSLERTYDKNGKPEKTKFTSRLIAFSAPVKN